MYVIQAWKYFSNSGVIKRVIAGFAYKRNGSLTMDLFKKQTVKNS